MSRWLAPLLACIAALPGIVHASHARADETVDVELILAVDVSLSMSPDELVIQRDGYAAALTHPVVIEAIRDGVHGRIAVTYVEWAGENVQHVVVPWRAIGSEADAKAFVSAMTIAPRRSARRTSISAAIAHASSLFDGSGFRGMKRVIDISGDGPNNQGEPVVLARDAATKAGITINGLPLMTNGRSWSGFDINNLDSYYADCVIGGPGAFMIPVNDWSQFPEAVRRKLVMELAGRDIGSRHAAEALRPPVIRASAQPPTDCLIGEKMWNNRTWIDIQ